MSDLSMKKEAIIRLIAKGSDAPLTGSQYRVRLFDKDFFDDDFLGESSLDETGTAHISFTHAAFDDVANLEAMPDFYFVVLKDGQQIFQSQVMQDVDIAAMEQFRMGTGEVIDLGTFLVEG